VAPRLFKRLQNSLTHDRANIVYLEEQQKKLQIVADLSRDDILLAPYFGPSLELIDGDQLIARLSELARR
jgi:hypothetical protein